MSTKNLARTAIEGGRYYSNCWFRRHSNRLQRPRERDALVQATRAFDPDDVTIPQRRQVWRMFRDKLSAPERWLDRQVGRPWHLVRGELLRRFDTRTTAGRHIVFDHMIPWVDDGTPRGGWRFDVDAHGLLRRLPRRRYRRTDIPPPLPRPQDEITSWLGGRCVGARGDDLYWFVPTAWGAYRQHHRLADDDAALWRSLPAWFRACHDPSKAPGQVQVRLRVS